MRIVWMRLGLFVVVSLAILLALGALLLQGCALTAAQQAALTSVENHAVTDGQLFCAINAAGGGAVVVGVVQAAVTAAAPSAAPVAVLATGAAQSFVNAVCKAVGGIPVIPPPNPAAAPQVAVVITPAETGP